MIATDSNEHTVIDGHLDGLLDANLNSIGATTFTVVSGREACETVIEVDGEVGGTTAARFRGALRYAIVCRPHTLIVDMTRINLIDSTGLTVLVAADRRCIDLGIKLLLMAPSDSAMRALKSTGLDRVLTVVADRQSDDRALAS